MATINLTYVTHNGARVRSLDGHFALGAFRPFEVETAAPEWSHAVSARLERPDKAFPLAHPASLFVVVDLAVEFGAIGLACFEADLRTPAGRELREGVGPRRLVYVPIVSEGASHHLLIRNLTGNNRAARAIIYGLETKFVTRQEVNGVKLLRSMSPHQLKNYQDYAPKHVFAVVSWGAAATAWLASVLNDCPEVLCLHAANSYWELFGGSRPLSGLEYLQILGMLGSATEIAGDVHGVSRGDIPEIVDFFGDQFSAAVLVREPLARIYSQLALFERYASVQQIDTRYLDEMLPDALGLLPAGSDGERVFVHGANMLNSIMEELTIGPIFRMEDVVSRPEVLIELVGVLSRGKVDPPKHWAFSAVSKKAVNTHSSKERRPLKSWQTEVLRAVVRDDAVAAYEKLGYDMAWLR
jgi:hypothetical protein